MLFSFFERQSEKQRAYPSTDLLSQMPTTAGAGPGRSRSQELATGLQHGQQGPTQASLLSSRVHFNRMLAPQENRALIRHKGVPSGVRIASVSNKEENVPSILRGKKLTFSSIYSDSIAEQ